MIITIELWIKIKEVFISTVKGDKISKVETGLTMVYMHSYNLELLKERL